MLIQETAFWRDEKLRPLASPLIQQISVAVAQGNNKEEDQRNSLPEIISDFASIINDDDLLKSVNLSILMQTRDEDSKLRIFALECSQKLWETNGSKLIGEQWIPVK